MKDLLTPLIAAIGGQPDFSAITFTVNNSRFLIGDFINAVVAFLIIAAVVFFLVVRPITALMARFKTEPPVAPETRECPYCLSSVPLKASRCAFCTAELPGGGEAAAPAPVSR